MIHVKVCRMYIFSSAFIYSLIDISIYFYYSFHTYFAVCTPSTDAPRSTTALGCISRVYKRIYSRGNILICL